MRIDEKVGPPVEKLKQLTERHIRRYRNHLRLAESGSDLGLSVNVNETRYYLSIWNSIQSKEFNWSQLNVQERREVRDALDDEE